MYLKWSYDIAKMNIIWCNAMHLCSLRLTFPHTVHYCFSFMLRLSETRFYKAHHSEKYSSFSSMRRKCYALRHIVMPCPGATTQKTIKHLHPVRVVITDYNDLFCIFMCHISSRRLNITMSAFVIGETTSTTLHC